MTASRREAVLSVLQAADGEWVNGTVLASAEVGGSEGLKRLRELRADGWPIEMRRHPDPDRTVRQYRLAGPWRDPSMPAPLPGQRELWEGLEI